MSHLLDPLEVVDSGAREPRVVLSAVAHACFDVEAHPSLIWHDCTAEGISAKILRAVHRWDGDEQTLTHPLLRLQTGESDPYSHQVDERLVVGFRARWAVYGRGGGR